MADKFVNKRGRISLQPYLVKANTIIDYNDIVGVGADGYLIPATDTAPILIVGLAEETIDTTGLADGAAELLVYRGQAKVKTTADATALVQADIGRDCFVQDTATVRKTDGTATANNLAGELIELTPDGAWVNFTGPR